MSTDVLVSGLFYFGSECFGVIVGYESNMKLGQSISKLSLCCRLSVRIR